MKNNISGVVLINKPVGLTSHDVVFKLRKKLKTKAGHTGTLDKMASGMLQVCLGEATKFVRYAVNNDKKYEAKLLFGYQSDTGDMEGSCIAKSDIHITQDMLSEVIKKFTGESNQLPPMYSAIKQSGQPLYKIARKGEVVERKFRLVKIHDIVLKEYNWPWVTLEIECGKGTYIRTLAEDIAKSLGTCAYLVALHRSWIKGYEGYLMNNLLDDDMIIHPMQSIFVDMPELRLDDLDCIKIHQGQVIHRADLLGEYKLFDHHDNFRGICMAEAGILRPLRLINID